MKIDDKSQIDILVIGFQKCGTSSIHDYLKKFPNLQSTKRKETYFLLYNKDKKSLNAGKLLFTSAPAITLMKRSVINKIFSHNKNIKIILLYRDPIERIFSACNMYAQKYPNDNYNFSFSLKNLLPINISDIYNYEKQINSCPYGSMYNDFLINLRDHKNFDKKNLLVLNIFEESNIENKLANFLNIKSKVPVMTEKINQKYKNFYNSLLYYLKEIVYFLLKIFSLANFFRTLSHKYLFLAKLSDYFLFNAKKKNITNNISIKNDLKQIILEDYDKFKQNIGM